MRTLEQFFAEPPQIPLATVWLLNDLAEYRGKQELFTRQSPQKLNKLKEFAIIESAVSSNRIEGVEIDQQRVGTVVFGKGALQNRDEAEIRGYQQALAWIHSDGAAISITSSTILRLHELTRPDTWDAGQFKEQDGQIIETHPDGSVFIRFKPLAAAETPAAIERTCTLQAELWRRREIPPLIVWAGFNLDFLCIHPFRDGNGRVSRLLLLSGLYHLGFEAGRYISLERLIEQSKERYYETLYQSSQGWHDGQHNPWLYINYLLFTLKELYAEFAQRYADMLVTRGEKTDIVHRAVSRMREPFQIAELQRQCPEVSLEMIRKVLKAMRTSGEVECLGRGKHARWRVTGNR